MKPIYIEDSYTRSFKTTVADVKGDGVILEETAFYPQSGGQPSDLGSLFRDEDEFCVLRVEPSGPIHILDRTGLAPGDRVSGRIDWDRRYRFMRSHTACHILSSVIFDKTGAKITGNQIDIARSRVDFSLEAFDKSKIAEYVDQANQLISEDHAVRTSLLPRAEAMTIPDLVRLAMDVPDREEIRVVEIEGVDLALRSRIAKDSEIAGIIATARLPLITKGMVISISALVKSPNIIVAVTSSMPATANRDT